jgi:cytochrome P450
LASELRDLERDPYPALAELRRRGPVQPGELMELLGTGLPMATGLDAVDGPPFTVLGFDEARALLRDESFSNAAYTATIGQFLGRTILEMDDPEHAVYRHLVSPMFRLRVLEAWREDFVGPEAVRMVTRLKERGSADLVQELTSPFPIRVIGRMLGLPPEDVDWFQSAASSLVALEGGISPAEQAQASASLEEYFRAGIAQRRQHPDNTVLGELCESEVDGEKLTDEEIVSFLRLLLPAGAETTFRSGGSMLFALLANPDQLSAVRADRTRARAAIEETLRWEPPIMGIGRTPTRPVTLGGVTIPAGSAVHIALGAANHDPRTWDRPDEFDIHRQGPAHLSFAAGPHTCIGLNLARVEMRAMLDAVVDVLPNVRLDEQAPPPAITGIAYRSPSALPVVWDPS